MTDTPRSIPREIDVLDPEFWVGPDRLNDDDGLAEFGLNLLRRPGAPDTDDLP